MTRNAPPVYDQRFSQILKILEGLAPHYIPEWEISDEKDSGGALLNIFAHLAEQVVSRLNQVPHKNLVAFLDMLGIKLLHAQPARVPLTFEFAEGTEKDILIPARTQAATDKTEEHEEIPFETEKNLLATISNFKEIVSVNPLKDEIYVHTPNVISEDGKILDEQKGFFLFLGSDQQEHSIYMGHKELLNIESTGRILLEVTMAPGSDLNVSGLHVIWEYWGEDTAKQRDEWITLQVLEDRTKGFKQSGKIVLFKTTEGKIKEEKIGEIFKKTFKVKIKDESLETIKTRWLRCRLKNPLTVNSFMKLPTLDSIAIKINPSDPILPDAIFFNDVPLDLTLATMQAKMLMSSLAAIVSPSRLNFVEIYLNPIYPFGKQPRLYDAFYIGSKEGFSKKAALVTLSLILTHENPALAPKPILSWEYWNGGGWEVLPALQDETNGLLEGGEKTICFRVPANIEETVISGQKNYWIRTRIVGGNYGTEEYTLDPASNKLKVDRKFKLPIILHLTIDYLFEKNEDLQHCLTYNNLDFQDKTSASLSQGEFFAPFIPMEDTHLNLYLGFESPLTSGPIRIFFAAKELSYTEEKKPKMDWNYKDEKGWTLLDYLDETEGLVVQGHLEIIGRADFIPHAMFGQSLYWIQGSLVKGGYECFPELGGIYPNTTWALQAETIREEILGSSNGEPDQTFSFSGSPVLEGEEVRVWETLSQEEKQALITSLGKEAIYEIRDEKENVIETWVLWSEVPDFFCSTEESRHYTLDRALAQLRFGDGVHGMIPPGGDDNVKVFSYQAGGGVEGNVKAREIKTLKSAVAGVEKVSNPVAADGGADTASLDQMLEIGPAMISHRGRAVATEDFEWLAKKASRKVAKVRCLANTNNKKQGEFGWVTVIIVPDSSDPKPLPSLELRRKVRKYLEDHSANTLAEAKHIYVDGPSYVEIGVSVEVFIPSMDVAAQVEREVQKKLNVFFHPLTGGPEGKGWDFGRDVSASDVYALLENTKGVDHVESLRFSYDGKINEEIVEVTEDFLVAAGIHTINLQLADGV